MMPHTCWLLRFREARTDLLHCSLVFPAPLTYLCAYVTGFSQEVFLEDAAHLQAVMDAQV